MQANPLRYNREDVEIVAEMANPKKKYLTLTHQLTVALAFCFRSAFQNGLDAKISSHPRAAVSRLLRKCNGTE